MKKVVIVELRKDEHESYHNTMQGIRDFLQRLNVSEGSDHGILQRFEDYFWLKKSNEQLQRTINELRDELFTLKVSHLVGNVGKWHLQRAGKERGRANLSAMIPATYKPMRWPEVGLRHYIED